MHVLVLVLQLLLGRPRQPQSPLYMSGLASPSWDVRICMLIDIMMRNLEHGHGADHDHDPTACVSRL